MGINCHRANALRVSQYTHDTPQAPPKISYKTSHICSRARAPVTSNCRHLCRLHRWPAIHRRQGMTSLDIAQATMCLGNSRAATYKIINAGSYNDPCICSYHNIGAAQSRAKRGSPAERRKTSQNLAGSAYISTS